MKVDLPDSPVPIYKKGKQLINAYKEQNHFTPTTKNSIAKQTGLTLRRKAKTR